MRSLAARLLRERDAQDLVEYALLVALVAFAGMAAWNVFQTRLNTVYTNYDSRTQALWASPNPLPVSPPAP